MKKGTVAKLSQSIPYIGDNFVTDPTSLFYIHSNLSSPEAQLVNLIDQMALAILR